MSDDSKLAMTPEDAQIILKYLSKHFTPEEVELILDKPLPVLRRELADLDIAFFTEYYLRPYILDWQPIPDIHLQWYQDCQTFLKIAIHAPRDHAKSSVFSFIYPLWRAVRNRNIRIIIVSKTATMAQNHLRQISWHLEFNERLIADYGAFRGDLSWSEDMLIVTGRGAVKDPTLRAIGYLSGLVGARADIVIVDDVEDLENTRSRERRDTNTNWFWNDLTPIVVAGGQILVVGTAQNLDDLIHRLKANPMYHYVRYQALSEYIDGEGTRQLRALWPERYPVRALPETECPRDSDGLEDCKQCPKLNPTDGSRPINCLRQKQVEVGTLFFNTQYQNDPSGMEGLIFKADWVRWYKESDISGFRDELRVFQGIDPAISERDSADDFAVLTIGVHLPTKRIYILDAFGEHVPWARQVTTLISKFEEFGPDRMLLEQNGYQVALKQDAISLGMLPLRGVTSKKAKYDRVVGMQPYFENGKIYLKEGMTKLVEQLLSFNRGDHDDLLDALEMAIQAYLQVYGRVVTIAAMDEELGMVMDASAFTTAPADPQQPQASPAKADGVMVRLEEARRKVLVDDVG